MDRRERARTPAPVRPAIRERRRRVTRWTVNVDAIERARILRCWTLTDLPRVAHVDRGTLSDLIHGVRQPTLGTVQAIVTALSLTMAEAIVFEGSSTMFSGHDGTSSTAGSSATPT